MSSQNARPDPQASTEQQKPVVTCGPASSWAWFDTVNKTTLKCACGGTHGLVGEAR